LIDSNFKLKSLRFILTWALLTILFSSICMTREVQVLPGIDVLISEYPGKLAGKRVGLVTNLSGVNHKAKLTIDVLHEHKDINLVALFGPEHGLRTWSSGMKKHKDPETGIPVYSLHKVTQGPEGPIADRDPTEEMMNIFDVLLFDVQDIGSRSFTYISTMSKCMEACAKYDKEFMVLDRPNPIGGLIIDGNILEPEWKSFIGYQQIPYCHGMTVGELALYFNTEFNINCRLTVIPMKNWKRDMVWEDTGLTWIGPAPLIVDAETSFHYPITGTFGELYTISIGIGYEHFKCVGAPTIDADRLAGLLNDRGPAGLDFEAVHFTPKYSMHRGKLCHGIRIKIANPHNVRPIEAALHIMEFLIKYYPDELGFDRAGEKRIGMFDKAFGTDQIRKRLLSGEKAISIIASYQDELEEFRQKRQKYLLY
jgi:uncharacterized protein YbbC (DUF1343 family)